MVFTSKNEKNLKKFTQIDGSIEFNKDSSITVVYIRLDNKNNLQKICSELLHYILEDNLI